MRTTHVNNPQTAIDEIFADTEYFLEELEEMLQKARSIQDHLNDDIDLSNSRDIEGYFRDMACRLNQQTLFARRLADEAETCITIITNDHNVMVRGEVK